MASLIPALQFEPELLLKAQSVRLVILDVDGVLTDGGLYFSEQGEALKRFSVLDGQGLAFVQRVGIQVAVITGRDSAALRSRLNGLGITKAAFGVKDKLPVAQKLLSELSLDWASVAVMGDDWPDLPLLGRAALAVTTDNAHAQNKALAHWTTHEAGGSGAVRALCDLLLTAQGQYQPLLNEFMR